jgi:hypothetical protein
MGSGLFKIVGFVAPVVLVVIWLTFNQQQEHKSEMRVESAQFDRDWNDAMVSMQKGNSTREGKQYSDRAVAAQGQFSSERGNLAGKRRKLDEIGGGLDKSVESFDAAVKAERGGK